jgi:hypothetical protein
LKEKKLRKLIRLLPVEGKLTKAVLAQICMGVFFRIFHSFSVSYNFCNVFLPRLRTAVDRLANRRRPLFEKHSYTISATKYKDKIDASIITSRVFLENILPEGTEDTIHI